MKLIRPFTVTDSTLTSSVSEADATEYALAGTYALGATVMNTTGASPTHHIYESLVANNTGNALTDAAKWLDLGPTNRWAMFDTTNGTATSNATSIDVTVAVTGRADGLALFGLDAEEVRVQMVSGGSTVFDTTYSLQSDSGVTSWYEYFSEDVVFKTDLVITDLPLYTNPSVRVLISKTSGTVSCGTMVLGQTRDLGNAVYGARAGINDYSKKETDDFGNYTIVQRSFAKRTTLKLVTDNTAIDELHSLLSAYRTTPAVWVGTDDYACTWIFGFYRSFDVEIAFVSQSYLSLEIEGLT